MIPRTRLVNYGGDASVCEVAAPSSAGELIGLLQHASQAGRRISFRCGGNAFDSQSLNDDLVIDLGLLKDLRFDPEVPRVEIEAGVRSGELFDAARSRGLIPHVIVTTESASIAGTASGNCISRFSPIYGRDGDWIRRLELTTVLGEQRVLTAEDPEFYGVIGGLGYLGAITRITLELQSSPHDQVETIVVAKGPLEDVLAACAPQALQEGTPPTRFAVLLPRLERGMAYQSRYVSGERLRRYRGVHQPRSFLRLFGELLMLSHLGARAVWQLGYWTLGKRYVDPLRDYTFFMEGNVRLRRLGRRLGREMRILQQSFVLPVDRAARFIEAARRVFHDARIVPMMSDVLYCLSDRSLLSATYGRSGFFVSFAFSPWRRARLDRIRRTFIELSSTCGELGGRVHLTKSVHADPVDLQSMYAETLPAFRAFKQRLDPNLRLRNAFLERIFPSLVS